MEKKDISNLKLELKEFTGTEQYYYNPLFPEHRYTDGVKFLAERAGAYWFIEFVFGYSEIPALEEEAFQVWKLIIHGDNSALIKVEDGNENILKQFKIPFTDFPLEQIDLWLINNVLILPSEYQEAITMTLDKFEKHLKAEGGYYYRSNITVHFYEDEKTGQGVYWGNYKGEETEDFDSLQELMNTHCWVEIPNNLNDESFPMCRNLPEIHQYKIEWEDITIDVTHKPKWAAMYGHIEVRAGLPIPITETGYRSIFLADSDIEEAGGVVELVKYLLEKEAKSSSWQKHQEATRQKTLF